MAHLGIICSLLAMAVVAKCAPIPQEIVDLTYTFDETTLYWPTHQKFELVVISNESASGKWILIENYYSGIHVGTHMDAPCHFAQDKRTVDQIPLDRLMGPAAVIDITSRAQVDSDALVQVSDLEKWEKLTSRRLDGHIVLIRSGWGSKWGDDEAFRGSASNDTTQFHFPGVSREAAQWLVDNRSIYGLGVETLSLDNGQSRDLMAHTILLENDVYGMESIANMDKLPIYGATLYVMPMKIGEGCGAPLRIVATFPKILHTMVKMMEERNKLMENFLPQIITYKG